MVVFTSRSVFDTFSEKDYIDDLNLIEILTKPSHDYQIRDTSNLQSL
jgi:hypothetical protein